MVFEKVSQGDFQERLFFRKRDLFKPLEEKINISLDSLEDRLRKIHHLVRFAKEVIQEEKEEEIAKKKLLPLLEALEEELKKFSWREK